MRNPKLQCPKLPGFEFFDIRALICFGFRDSGFDQEIEKIVLILQLSEVCLFSAPKGHNIKAQGNALGQERQTAAKP